MPGRISAPLGFAYLFERFPSFSQTFCVREVEAMHGRGLEFPVFSIRKPAGEPVQDYFSDIGPIYFLPEKFDRRAGRWRACVRFGVAKSRSDAFMKRFGWVRCLEKQASGTFMCTLPEARRGRHSG